MKLILGFLASTLIAGASYGKTCDVAIEATDAMSYNTKIIAAAGCSELKITLKHAGKLPKAAMGHNLVITAEADMKAVVGTAAKAGFAKDYGPARSTSLLPLN